ncbi:MAG: ribbon-helix-helix domain-containing protein [Ignisphaera sp.]
MVISVRIPRELKERLERLNINISEVVRELLEKYVEDVEERLGIGEGAYLELRVEGGKLVATPIPDPFWLALKGPKFAETTVEEVESISEEEQRRLEDENTS